MYTGQELGAVGDTGNARGCHLHFEEWTSPGWYDGGRPFDPLPDLKRWDRAQLSRAYSHSIVLGGFDEMSSATRFTWGISLMMRLETFSSRS